MIIFIKKTGMLGTVFCGLSLILGTISEAKTSRDGNELRFIQVSVNTKEKRSELASLGVSIEAVRSDSIWGFYDREGVNELKIQGFKVLTDLDFSAARGGHGSIGTLGFPSQDARYHDYDELTQALLTLEKNNPDIARVQSLGKTLEGRDIWVLHINNTLADLNSGISSKPGAFFVGSHHAREHLSTEVPLMLAEKLLAQKNDPTVKNLIETRDIWIAPMLNVDGALYDIQGGNYRMWRKNRRKNSDGTFGVDLNRNYGFKWGTGGSSKNGRDDTFMGPTPFSEPESQAIKKFVDDRPNLKTLLSFHSFSELVLYPWGHSHDSIQNNKDLAVFKKMAETMSKWNGYTPEQSSDLYIASGDTTDWAYGEHGIFAFTFELSPTSIWNGGFYPGASVIDKVFNANWAPCLYMIEKAMDPYSALTQSSTFGLKNYVQPAVPELLKPIGSL